MAMEIQGSRKEKEGAFKNTLIKEVQGDRNGGCICEDFGRGGLK